MICEHHLEATPSPKIIAGNGLLQEGDFTKEKSLNNFKTNTFST